MTSKLVNESNATSSLSLNKNDSSVPKDLGQQDFLPFMVAQTQQHEALQAQINRDFLSQLDKFSTNNGIAKMYGSFQQMATSLQSNQALQASAFVGRKVLVNCDHLTIDAEGEVKIVIDISSNLTWLNVSVYTISEVLIKTITLEQPEPGFFQFNWDGIGGSGQRVKEGIYKVAARAIHEGKELYLKTMICANVDSVSLDPNGEGFKLNVSGVGAISLDQIRQISV